MTLEQIQPVRLSTTWSATTHNVIVSNAEVPHRIGVSIVRRSIRARCSLCLRRRVVYRVRVDSFGGGDYTDARCAPCWGIRE